MPRLWREGRGKRKEDERKKKKRRKKKERGGKKEDTRRFGEERRREGEGSLVHGEIARPLTILRYYARPFLQRQPLLARARNKPAAILGYGIEREKEPEGEEERTHAAGPFQMNRSDQRGSIVRHPEKLDA